MAESNIKGDISNWTIAQQASLLEQVLQKGGTKVASYQTIKKRIKWEDIQVEGKSAESCETMFTVLTDKVRKFRLFEEIIHEAKQGLNSGYSYEYCVKYFPGFPKKPKNAVSLFMEDIKEELNNLPGTERFQALGKRWQACSVEEKEQYKERARKQTVKFNKKVEKFRQQHPDISVGMKQSIKKPNVSAPVLPTPVSVYTAEHKTKIANKHPELNEKQIVQKCAAKYSNLKDKKKVKWILLAQEQMSEYKEQCEAYAQKHPNKKLKPATLSKSDLKILQKSEGRPDPPPTTFFQYFCGVDKTANGLTFAERAKIKSAHYKELSAEDRQQLEDEYKEVVQTYIDSYTAYYDQLPEEKKQRDSEQKALTVLKSLKRLNERMDTQKKAEKAKRPTPSASDSETPAETSPKSPEKTSPKKSSSKSPSPKKSLQNDIMANNTDDDMDDFDETLLSFSTSKTTSSKTSKNKEAPKTEDDDEDAAVFLTQSASKKKKKKKKSLVTASDDTLLSFFGPSSSRDGAKDTSDTSEGKSPKKKSKKNLLSLS